MTEREEWYYKEIAPKIHELADLCGERGMAFVSVVEYSPGQRSTTSRLPEDSGLAMTMLRHCANMGENVDGYFIGLKKYYLVNGIDTSRSFVISMLAKGRYYDRQTMP